MHPVVWLIVALLLVGGAGSLWSGLRRDDANQPWERPEVLAGFIGLLSGTGMIAREHWSSALGTTLMAASAVASLALIIRLVTLASRAKDA